MAETIRNYETIFIMKPDLTEEDTAAIVDKFKTIIEENGKIISVDDWGTKRLAYKIDFYSEGHYVLINFEAPVSFPAELERRFNIADGIMRSIIVCKN